MPVNRTPLGITHLPNGQEIHLLSAAEDPLRAAVCKLRYDVFVRERKCRPPDADHIQFRIRDRLDPVSTVIAAVDATTHAVVGTGRTTLMKHGAVSVYPELYRVSDLNAGSSVLSTITTYLAIAPAYRRKGLSTKLLSALYTHRQQAGVRFDFLDCPTALVPYFVRLGYRWERALNHPWFGPSHLMRLALFDTEHLKAIRSPLVPKAETPGG